MHLHEPRKKLCLNDITYFSTKNVSPFSYSSKQTVKRSLTPKNKKRSPSPLTIKQSRGMMKETVARRIQQYKNDNKSLFSSIQKIKKEEQEMRKSPKMNTNSQKLYQKISKERNLSPNVLERFERYQKDRTYKKIKNKILSYHQNTHRLPSPTEIVENKCQRQMQRIKQMIQFLKRSQQKYLR